VLSAKLWKKSCFCPEYSNDAATGYFIFEEMDSMVAYIIPLVISEYPDTCPNSAMPEYILSECFLRYSIKDLAVKIV
jgi:hypothetical protein